MVVPKALRASRGSQSDTPGGMEELDLTGDIALDPRDRISFKLMLRDDPGVHKATIWGGNHEFLQPADERAVAYIPAPRAATDLEVALLRFYSHDVPALPFFPRGPSSCNNDNFRKNPALKFFCKNA